MEGRRPIISEATALLRDQILRGGLPDRGAIDLNGVTAAEMAKMTATEMVMPIAVGTIALANEPRILSPKATTLRMIKI